MGTQDRLNTILITFICCVTCLLLNCQNIKPNEQNNSQVNTKSRVSQVAIKNQIVELSYAIKSRNYDILKLYFTFPVNNQYIWYKVLSENELENKNVSQPFTCKDFEKYYNNFFDIDLDEAIATLNFDNFFVDGVNCIKSDTISVQNGPYLNKFVLLINLNDNDVIFSILSNLYDENNELLSEHTDKYYFVFFNKRLHFSNFEMID